MAAKSGSEPATPTQGVLDLGIEIQRQVNGIEMGVLDNGIPYLTQRGLAEITGVPRSVIQDITREWSETHGQPFLEKTGSHTSGANFSKRALMNHDFIYTPSLWEPEFGLDAR